jgi:hypothetical protein
MHAAEGDLEAARTLVHTTPGGDGAIPWLLAARADKIAR